MSMLGAPSKTHNGQIVTLRKSGKRFKFRRQVLSATFALTLSLSHFLKKIGMYQLEEMRHLNAKVWVTD
ncbi:hypothetical protein CDAR_446201 [Caerostris darwini]|uniref:Uncharacterized protein n=1 Tax=Caerostris darwini TaxID=1538125 RepID=A0AAV4U8S8_9ARAC|nr:hypothetical protein CDAR_446201 [Caerostris darwini]